MLRVSQMKPHYSLRKLSAKDVKKLREMRASGSTLEYLANFFGIHQKGVYLILSGASYKEIV